MREACEGWLRDALAAMADAGELPEAARAARVEVGRPRRPEHGDFSSGLALSLAAAAGLEPLELARRLCRAAPLPAPLREVAAAAPGFINFRCAADPSAAAVAEAVSAAGAYGRCEAPGAGRSALVEFVSANPTGPLHVGHGRGAAYGDSLANLLAATGHRVRREYYVNDRGRQAGVLALSLWLRYLEAGGAPPAPFPEGGYQGGYLADAAAKLRGAHGRRFEAAVDWPPERADGDGDDDRLDAMAAAARAALGEARWAALRDWALGEMLSGVREELEACGVRFDRWLSESELVAGGACERALGRLAAAGATERRGGAVWFAATRFGDDKDRVLVRANGEPTYFAADVAYHLDKFERGFDRAVDVWGADHHGYAPRLRAALSALGVAPERLSVRLVQTVSLRRGGGAEPMSTRAGRFVSLRALREEVGPDALRLFFLLRRAEQPVEFDPELALARGRDNPVYYMQYAHARLCSVRRAAERGGAAWDRAAGLAALGMLGSDEERALMACVAGYPPLVRRAAERAEPSLLANGLREAAAAFHAFYHRHRMLCDDAGLRAARLCLGEATRHVLANGLALLGVSAPEEM